MEPVPVKVYPILPAHITGDLWHLAAAAILCGRFSSYQNPNKLHVVPVVVISELAFHPNDLDTFVKDEKNVTRLLGSQVDTLAKRPTEKQWTLNSRAKDLKNQYRHGAASFNFFKNLGLDCVLIVIKGGGYSHSQLEGSIWEHVSDGKLDEILDAQRKLPGYSKLGLYQTWEALANNKNKTLADGWLAYEDRDPNVVLPESKAANDLGSRRLNFMAGTTAAMTVLLDPVTRKERLDFLSFTLSYDAVGLRKSVVTAKREVPFNQPESDKIAEQSALLVNQFEDLVLLLQLNDKTKNKEVVIYNNRGNDVNAQTSSTTEVYQKFRNYVRKFKPMATIVIINTGGPMLVEKNLPRSGEGTFNLFKIGDIDQVYPGIDPLVTCQFFNKISNLGYVFGMFSGRSGSCDVAAFNGLNCFIWDTPYIEIATYQEKTFQSYAVNKANVAAIKKFESTGEGKPEDLEGWHWSRFQIEDEERKDVAKPTHSFFEGLRPFINDTWQMQQTYRVLQQYLFMAVGYPANNEQSKDRGLAAWNHMRTESTEPADPFYKWLVEGRISMYTPLFPLCPPIPAKDKLSPDTWAINLKTRKPGFLPDSMSRYYEGCSRPEVEKEKWLVRADALAYAGYTRGNQSKPNFTRALDIHTKEANSGVPHVIKGATHAPELSKDGPNKPPLIEEVTKDFKVPVFPQK